MTNFLRIFEIRTEHQNSQKLANFFKFQSISIHAIRSDRPQKTVSVPSNSLIYLCLIIFGTPEFYAFIVEADTLTSKSIPVNEFYNVPLAFAVKQ